MKITPKIAKSGISSYEEGFENFFSTLRPSLKLWGFFVNWDKVFRNTKEIEIQLNIWNYLLGKPNFDQEFRTLLKKHPEIVRAIPSLIVRDGNASEMFQVVEDISDITKQDELFDFSHPAKTDADIDKALIFVRKTGLIKLFSKEGVKNLVDYVIGVEAGLDSNGRKNRSGTNMESVVEAYLTGFTKGKKLKVLSQATPKRIKEQWGFTVPVDKSSRSFDFAVSDGKQLVLIEVNFYGGGGSKLKATAGEYKGLYDLLKTQDDVKFVWITDGAGWNTARLPLEAAYKHIDYVWNLNWLSKDYLEDLFK
jgi:type II restriction enzyme